MRRRKGKFLTSEEDANTLLQQCREQLAVQSKTLAENTQELEIRTHQVNELQGRLAQEEAARRSLEEALENMVRTNKLMQSKLQQQILKDAVSKAPTERKLMAVVDAARVPTTVPELPVMATSSTHRVLDSAAEHGDIHNHEASLSPQPTSSIGSSAMTYPGAPGTGLESGVHGQPSTAQIDYKSLGFAAQTAVARTLQPLEAASASPKPREATPVASDDKSTPANLSSAANSSVPRRRDSRQVGAVTDPKQTEGPPRAQIATKGKSHGGGCLIS
jgi:hypothetical protein